MNYIISYNFNGKRNSILVYEWEAESYVRNLAHWMLQGFKFSNFKIKEV